jgi:hypothetical protein
MLNHLLGEGGGDHIRKRVSLRHAGYMIKVTTIRESSTLAMRRRKVCAYEGFCEDLARQITVAHLSQLQLRFRRCHIWVSMSSHMGFSDHRGVLKATI